MGNVTLGDSIHVEGRFQRSVHLALDYQLGALGGTGYALSATGRELAIRMLAGSHQPGQRSWCIVGPYGTGKSAFSLFVAQTLSGRNAPGSAAADFRSERGIEGEWASILVVGERSSLRHALLRAVLDSAGKTAANKHLAAKIRTAIENEGVTDTEVVALIEEAGHAAVRAGRGGLLLVVDELGKFLEHAVRHPAEDDAYLLQALSETIERVDYPAILCTVLHSSLVDYLPRHDTTRRSEWAKVQGRYQEVTFVEPPEQTLRLLRLALRSRIPTLVHERYYERPARRLLASPSLAEVRLRGPWRDDVAALPGINPIVALLLGPLFRSELAQHERSLFSFLASHEPRGFGEFLAEPLGRRTYPTYDLDRLYDYVTSSLGQSLYRSSHGRLWAEVRQALERLPARSDEHLLRVVKALGLLTIAGTAVGLRADATTIAGALGLKRGAVDEALAALEQLSIAVFRHHSGSYALWEGSDVDLDAALDEARSKVARAEPATALMAALELRPFVARAHYVETGTLRAFPVSVLPGDVDAMEAWTPPEDHAVDGHVVFVLPRSAQDAASLVEAARRLSRTRSPSNTAVLWAVPKPLSGLPEAAAEYAAWQKVASETPALAGDRVARAEAEARKSFAAGRLATVAGATLGARGCVFRPELSTWVRRGDVCSIPNARAFQRWLSGHCEEVFALAPRLANELINREIPTASASRARNALMRAMLGVGSSRYRLGIPGTPAEVSVYESVLRASGLHRELEFGRWGFAEPTEATWQGAWGCIRRFLAETEARGRAPVSALFERLGRAPYGIRRGPLPILMAAALLLYGDRIGLYSASEGVLIPELRDEVLELLARNPEEFEVQLYDTSSPSASRLLQAVAAALAAADIHPDRSTGLLRVVRPLIVFVARLPMFSRRTRTVSSEAVALRDVLLRAKDPLALLRRDLPTALGLPHDDAPVEEIGKRLQGAVVELRRAYPMLLDSIEAATKGAFGLEAGGQEALEELKTRAAAVESICGDRDLRVFVREVVRPAPGDWRERLGRCVQKGRPPRDWADRDLAEYGARLLRLQSDFARLEQVAAEQGAQIGKVVRVGVLNGTYRERFKVVRVTPSAERAVENLAGRLREILQGAHDTTGSVSNLRLAALARLLETELSAPAEQPDA